MNANPLGRWLLGGAAALGVIFLALPLVVIVSASFTATEYLAFPPRGLTLRWYAQFLQDSSYLQSIGLSAQLAVAATATALVLGIPVALVLARSKNRVNTAIAALFLSPLALPTIVIGAALLQFATKFGFARTWFALYVGHCVLVIPYVVRTGLASLAGFQLSLEEAAQDLGAARVQTFFLVTLPIMKPGVIAGALFGLIISWVNVELSIFHSTAALMPLPVKLFNYVQYSIDPMIAAVSAGTIYVAVAVVLVIDWVFGIDRINAG
ncbi:polyamine ABC transporter permease [Pandoraea eparura]|uniref:Polyamine ABC transporter permease n=1 Tax=Pandoraea eparura TaxID=2508291 RepID=A0A5E4RDW3_9BURK|nr:ABC transporter permease [Pandoraea eparura]VVD60664.1 polyamine ABC transporter permease [Pandoraea eparura]